MTPRTRWLNYFTDRSYDMPVQRRPRGVPSSTPAFVWCDRCAHRGYIAKADAKAARSAHRGRRKGLSVYRCPHDGTTWHYGPRPPELTRGELDRRTLAERQRERRLREVQDRGRWAA
ncbi:hypothetical protein [Nocardia wallacei]|uniref:hypothetical protein n=1 Tax=Nocardia wallacei TaxID=480035 RepID=UPI002456B39F|nr:hypothetical protein [Nocardia wallacei]